MQRAIGAAFLTAGGRSRARGPQGGGYRYRIRVEYVWVLPLLMVDNSAPHADRLTTWAARRILPQNLVRSESVREVADAARLVLAYTPAVALPGLAGLDMAARLFLPTPVHRCHRADPAAPQTTHPRRL